MLENAYVKKLSKNDIFYIEEVSKISLDLFGEQSYYSKDELLKSLETDAHKIDIIIYKNEVTGYLYYSKVIDEVEIYQIGIKKEYQNHGFGSELIYQLLCKDIKKCYLEVDESNINAIKFYESNGFKKYYVRKDYYTNHHDAYLYQWELGYAR